MNNASRYLVIKVINANEFILDCFYTQAERRNFLEKEENKLWKKCTWKQLNDLKKAGFSQKII